MWHHPPLTGWNLKTVCILSRLVPALPGEWKTALEHIPLAALLQYNWKPLCSQGNFSSRGVSATHSSYFNLDTPLIFSSYSWVRTRLHSEKKTGKSKNQVSFWKIEMSLCSDNGLNQPLLWIMVVPPHFILTFSSLCSLISSPSQLPPCENEISYLKDKRWKRSKSCFIFSERFF